MQTLPKSLALLPLVLSLGATPTATAPSAPAQTTADYSEPKKSVATFLTALGTHNDAAIRDALYIAPDDKDAAESFLNLMAAAADLQKAAQARFRDAKAVEEYFGTNTASQLEARLKSVNSANVQVAGDTALIELPTGTIALKKVESDWKLDASALFGIHAGTVEEGTARIALAGRLVTISRDLAKDIALGKFSTAADAYKEYWSRAHTILAAGPATTATAPAATATAAATLAAETQPK